MRNRSGGYGGSSFDYDREFGTRRNLRPYDIAYRNEARPGGGWSGYSDEGLGAGYGRAGRGRERMTFEPRHEYDRDMGDQLREGWQDLKRNVQRAFGGGYDRGYGGSERGYRGSRQGMGGGYGGRDRGRGRAGGYGEPGVTRYEGGGYGQRHGVRDAFGSPRYGSDYQW